MRRVSVVVLIFAVAALACGETADAPSIRAVGIETSGCGFAAGRSGSGIAVGGDLVVTVAHLVVQADEVSVVSRAGTRYEARPVAIATARDIAVLEAAFLDMPPARYASAAVGDTGVIAGGPGSREVGYEVLEVAEISIEEVLGTERFARRGYKLDAATAMGDSGAGMYDPTGALIGMVFAISADEAATWATSSGEIERLLVDMTPASLRCDPAASKMVAD